MPQPPPGLRDTISLDALRWLLDITTQRVAQLERDGLIQRVSRGTYTIASVRSFVRTVRERGEGPRAWNKARTELAKERAATARFARMEREGKLLPRDLVETIFRSVALIVRN